MAQVVLPIGGAILTTAMGLGPAVGWAAGSLLAAVFFPPDLGNSVSEGPRLGDLKVTNADYGAPIPIAWGTVGGIAGSIIWAKDIEEVRTENSQEVGGKGGPSGTITTVTYSYFASFAVAFGEGPAAELLRVWGDNKLILDNRRVPDEVVAEFPTYASEEEILEDILKWTGTEKTFDKSTSRANIRFYTGSEDQEIDPLIQADKGDLANANNGIVYVVFERLPLANFGNRIPNITAEIMFLDTTDATIPEYDLSNNGGTINRSADVGHLAIDWENSLIARSAGDNIGMQKWDNYLLDADENTDTNVTYEKMCVSKKTGYIYGIHEGGWAIIDPVTLHKVGNIWYNGFLFSPGVLGIQSAPSSIPGVEIEFLYHIGAETGFPSNRTTLQIVILSQDGLSYVDNEGYSQGSFELGGLGAPTLPEGNLSGGGFLSGAARTRTDDIQSIDLFLLSCWEGSGLLPAGGDENTVWQILQLQIQGVGTFTESPFITIIREETVNYTLSQLKAKFPTLPWPPAAAGKLGVRLLRNMAMDKSTEDLYVIHINVEDKDNPGTYNVDLYFAYHLDLKDWIWGTDNFNLGVEKTRGVLMTSNSSSLLLNSNTYGSTFELVYVSSGVGQLIEYDMQDASIIATYTLNQPSLSPGNQSPTALIYDTEARGLVYEYQAYSATPFVINFKSGVAQPVNVQDILNDLSNRVGLAPGIYTETTPATCAGFYTTGSESIRDAIGRLGVAYTFNVIESDFSLKVKNLSDTPTIIDIPEADLTENSNNDILKESRVAEVNMPQAYSLTYLNPEFEYQPTTATAKIYNTGESITDTRNVAKSVMSIVLDKDEAKQLAEIILESSWQERWGLEYGASQRYIAVEPTDTIRVTTSNATLVNRLTSLDLGVNFKLDLRGVNTDSSTYLSESVTDGNLGYRPPSLETASRPRHFILNTPLLLDADYSIDDVIYHAAASYGTSQFYSINLEYSESGNTYVPAEVFTNSAAWGYVTSVIPDVGANGMPFTPDDKTVITLQQVAGTPLASVTDDALLTDYANAIAVIRPGHTDNMEIIQFRDVVNNVDGTIDVSYILRGRRGTEVFGRNYAGTEMWVLLNYTTIRKTIQPDTKIGEPVYYKTSVLGELADTALINEFTSVGNSLKAYAPVHVYATTDGTDIEIFWTNRGRIKGDWRDGTGFIPTFPDGETFEVVVQTPSVNSNREFTVVELYSTTYTNAQIMADFGYMPTELTITVYQITKVGRGLSDTYTVEVTNE